MKEIGGYLELEKNYGLEYYNYLTFNSSRNSLQYLIRKRNIKKIYIPYYLCLVVKNALEYENVDINYYHIDVNFMPIIDNCDNESYVYIVNYFGLLSKKDILSLKDKYKKIILDNTHNFYMKGFNDIDTIYNCRKYFGVPDGSYLYTDIIYNDNYTQSSSLNRINHLFGRYEKSASEYYQDFIKSDESFNGKDIELMSKITHNMLKGINYEKIKEIRENNFNFLNNKLKNINLIKINDRLNFMYPLLIENGKNIKKYLINNKIYVPTLWPELEKMPLNKFEKNLINNLIMLPIDQRYNNKDMEHILYILKKFKSS